MIENDLFATHRCEYMRTARHQGNQGNQCFYRFYRFYRFLL